MSESRPIRTSPPRAARRRRHLRTALAALSLSGVLPLLAFASGLLWLQWQTRIEDGRSQLRQAVRTLAVAIELELDASVRQLADLSDAPSLGPESLERFHGYITRLTQRRRGWENVTLIDRDGVHVVNGALAFGDRLPPRDDIPYRQVFETGTHRITDVFRSRRSDLPGVAILVPVMRDGAVRWVLGARLSLDHLGTVLRSTLSHPDALAAINDPSGLIVARSRAHERFVGAPAPEGFLRLASSGPSGIGHATTLEGGAMLVAWETLSNGWTVAHAVPRTTAEAPLRRSMLLLAGFGTLLLCGVLTATLWTSRRIGGEVDTAARDADDLATERSIPQRSSSIAEIDRLFHANRRTSLALSATREERDRAIRGLREAVDRRDQFLAMLAHELRNPLAPLTTALHLMKRRGALDDTDRALRDMGERQTKQLARLVDDLLDMSRVANGKIRLQLEPMSMTVAVREAAEAARPEIEASGQCLQLELPGTAPIITGDRARIAQVLHNLLGNAAKFGRAGGTVRLALRTGRDEAVIAVSDDGIGIASDRLQDLFEPFSQIEPSLDRRDGGLGLGLAMVRQLVTMHGGTVEAASDGSGRGTCFTVRIPLTPEA